MPLTSLTLSPIIIYAIPEQGALIADSDHRCHLCSAVNRNSGFQNSATRNKKTTLRDNNKGV